MSLNGKTLFISGGSRGIRLAITLRAAREVLPAEGCTDLVQYADTPGGELMADFFAPAEVFARSRTPLLHALH